jgi:hypothetical protein
MDIPN